MKLKFNQFEGDYHINTVKYDKAFRRMMDRSTWFLWRFWRLKKKRGFAKQWNHAKIFRGM